MARIKVNIEGLRNNRSDIQKQLAELQQLNSKLEGMINTIDASWEGQASKAYRNMMMNYLKKARNQEQILQEVMRYIQSAINKFETTDKKSSTRIRGAF